MTSPSSSIVVVDKTGTVDASNLIQTTQHVHQAQLQPIRAQQVILNEDYLSGDSIVRAGNVNYLIPMPSSTSQMLKPTISQHSNSKVHVISNVTLVSKADQSQPQTINFVNSKHIQSSSAQIGSRAPISSGNYVNISTKSQLQNKMFKASTITQMDQQTHIISTQQQASQQQQQLQQQQQQQQKQQQQQHIITKHLNNASAIVQKVIPRNILVSTGRIQNKIEPTSIARPTQIVQHHASQMGNVIQIQKPSTISINKTNSLNVNSVKSTKGNQQSIKLVNQTIGVVSGVTGTTIKHGNASTVKTITSTTISNMANSSVIQQKNQTKIPYNVHNSKTSHEPSQQKPQVPGVQANISAHNRNNNNNNNNNTINANTKIVQHPAQRTMITMNNMCVQPNVVGHKAKNTSTGKYIAQTSPSISNISQLACMPSTQYRSNENMQGTDQRIATYRTIQPTDARSLSVTKSVTMINHPINIKSESGNQQSTKKDTEWNQFRHRNGVEMGISHDYRTTSDVGTKPTTAPSSVDDVIMVNGTHMSEEMSARILQSLSQKVVFHTNNNVNNSNTPSIPSNRNAQQGQMHRPVQASFHRAIQPAPYKTAQTRSYTEYANKSGPEYFRVNTSDIQSTTSTFVDNIPLVTTRGDESYSNTNDMDDDIIGEEVRPKPIDSSMDSRMQALHALLQDHTYVQWPIEKQAQLTSITNFASNNTSNINSNINHSNNNSSSKVITDSPAPNLVISNISEPSTPSKLSSPSNKPKQSAISQTTEIPIVSNISLSNQTTSPRLSTKYQQQTGPTPVIPGYSFGYNEMTNKDDDTYSAISNGSRNKSDIDQGEETETAPEAGNEDDSVTRCICELTHDDGYMICCDKCSVWQHVDCMGIDRQNIPEEYKCELCQPRAIDQNRARTLQLMKRKEQQNFLMMKQSNQNARLPVDSDVCQANNSSDRSQLNTFSTIVANKKKGTLSAKSRKNDLFGANSKRKRSDSIRGGSRRRESKKSLSKRKSHSGSSSNATTPVKPVSVDNDKQSSNLRQWIENYEAAMTNHYSPELRARLHSISKQISSSTSISPMLKDIGSSDNKCTTVPHAGAKILISTREIAPNNPVIEIRGKYMLSTQFKPQQQSSSPPAANGTRNIAKMQPGPFLFFYRLPNDGPEICVDTRTYGNEARFVRRSCRPNAEIFHSIEKGTPHLYIVSLNTIRSSTEITIKHEPHDLESLDSGEISAPTSTSCGCGLIKDCIFGVNNSSTPASSQPGTPTSLKKSSKKSNGHIKEKNVSSQYRKKNKIDKGLRNCSEASLASTANGGGGGTILSPTKSSTEDLDKTALSEDVSAKQHSSNDKAQKDLHGNKHEKVHPKNNNSIDEHSLTDKKQEQSPAEKSLNVDTKQKDITNIELATPLSPSKHEEKFDGIQSRTMKSPPTTPISASSTKSPSAKSSQKKNTRKSTCSLSEDTGDEYSHGVLVPKMEKESKKTENKKLTREERKMEAIVRAFEKMEKTEQRKNEQNKHKSGSFSHNCSSSSSKKRNSSSFVKDDGDKLKKSSIPTGKRKRKRGKSYSQSSSQKRRRNRFDSHNSEDGNTSDDSSTPMMSPTRLQDLDRQQRTPNRDKGDNMAAGLLLSLSNYGLTKTTGKNTCLSSPERYSTTNKSQSNTPPFAVSSACLLIEAAVGPLDNDFKLPTKTKTKKTIMNEWLHQSDGTSFSSHNQDQRRLSPLNSMDSYTHGNSNTNSYSHEEPRNLSIAAQKIEEFIHLTSGEHIDDDECSKWSGSPICTSSDAMAVPTPFPTPPLQMGSSVKKRWLRQAISEECSDELLASSATSSPPNGFMAPLKKRRVARQCSDLNIEDLPSPKEDTKDLNIEDETSESKIDADKVMEDEETKIWQDLDSKTETELEAKEPLNEESSTSKCLECESKSMMVDVDKFEPIESDEDEDMCRNMDIKKEINDSQDKPPEEDIYNREANNEDSKSQDYLEIKNLEESKTDGDDFIIEQIKSEIDDVVDRKADSLLPSVLPKNEIEDIQQKLHSFHSENLMILQTRNKKRASRATTPTSLDEILNSNSNSNSNNNIGSKDALPFVSGVENGSKNRKFSSDDREHKRETSLTKTQNDDESSCNSYQSTVNLNSLTNPNCNAVNKSMTPNNPYSSYALNTARIETNQSIPPTQMYQSVTPSSFTNVNPQINPNLPSSSSLYQYLENPNRPSGYNASYNPPHMFSVNTSVPPPTLLNSSNYLTKSYSTLSEPSTPVSLSTPVVTQTNNPINPKVLSRTQSADPRLNPPKDLPPVTPKRKLSINEYRKRKQLTTPAEKPKVDFCEKIESVADVRTTEVEDKPKNGMAVADATKETVFSPAPTLLEMQQENLSRRLKSYKSLQGLSSQIELIKQPDSSLENEISEALSNSSLTPASSPKSNCDFDDGEMNDPLPSPEEQITSEATCANPGDTQERSFEPSANDFDLEPAEPTTSKTSESLNEPEELQIRATSMSQTEN